MFKKKIDFICFFWLENISKIGKGVKNIISPDEIGLRSKFFLKQFFKSIYRLSLPSLRYNNFEENDHLVKGLIFVQSQNNYNASKEIYDYLENTYYLISNDNTLEKLISKNINVNFRYTLLYQFIYFFPFLSLMINRRYRRLSNVIYETIGLYEGWIKILKKINPEYIIFFNDHSLKSRSLLLASKHLCIKTIYIQHAPVNRKFPPLEFDISLLDGVFSENIYRNKTSTIYKVFPSRYINYIKSRKDAPKKISIIGIAFNEIDDLSKVESLIKFLKNKTDKIIIRPHPADSRNYDNITNISGVQIDKSDSSLAFLSGIDLLISGNSGIHLEANLINIQSIIVNISIENKVVDDFDFIKNGICFKALDYDSIISYIDDYIPIDEHYRRSRIYVDTANWKLENVLNVLGLSE